MKKIKKLILPIIAAISIMVTSVIPAYAAGIDDDYGIATASLNYHLDAGDEANIEFLGDDYSNIYYHNVAYANRHYDQITDGYTNVTVIRMYEANGTQEGQLGFWYIYYYPVDSHMVFTQRQSGYNGQYAIDVTCQDSDGNNITWDYSRLYADSNGDIQFLYNDIDRISSAIIAEEATLIGVDHTIHDSFAAVVADIQSQCVLSSVPIVNGDTGESFFLAPPSILRAMIPTQAVMRGVLTETIALLPYCLLLLIPCLAFSAGLRTLRKILYRA